MIRTYRQMHRTEVVGNGATWGKLEPKTKTQKSKI